MCQAFCCENRRDREIEGGEREGGEAEEREKRKTEIILPHPPTVYCEVQNSFHSYSRVYNVDITVYYDERSEGFMLHTICALRLPLVLPQDLHIGPCGLIIHLNCAPCCATSTSVTAHLPWS